MVLRILDWRRRRFEIISPYREGEITTNPHYLKLKENIMTTWTKAKGYFSYTKSHDPEVDMAHLVQGQTWTKTGTTFYAKDMCTRCGGAGRMNDPRWTQYTVNNIAGGCFKCSGAGTNTVQVWKVDIDEICASTELKTTTINTLKELALEKLKG